VDAAYHRLLDINMDTPEGGYKGGYVEEIAADIMHEQGDTCLNMETAQRLNIFRAVALHKILEDQKDILKRFGLVYDVWFSEKELRETGAVDGVLSRLNDGGYAFMEDGATWFRSTSFGDEKDRVLITGDGNPTYFLGDIAYHRNKFERGFNLVIDLWGPDHHGHIPRMKAAVEALGYDPDALEIRIVQQVNLLRGGAKAKMSKREGRLVSMAELIDEVGADVARFFFLMRKTSAHLDFDLDLAKEQSEENPVYYVQYAHARICSIVQHAVDSGIKRPELSTTNLSLLASEEEIQLIKKLFLYPEIIEICARNLEPQGLTTYLQDVAAAFHLFYHHHRVVTEDRQLTAARLILVEAVKSVLGRGLTLLGISSPEKM
jgi:arginyl-tRNA synthetase